jgi:hypothetical protein
VVDTPPELAELPGVVAQAAIRSTEANAALLRMEAWVAGKARAVTNAWISIRRTQLSTLA